MAKEKSEKKYIVTYKAIKYLIHYSKAWHGYEVPRMF